MFVFGHSRAGACAAVFVAACIISMGSADARPKAKSRAPDAERIADIPIPKFSGGNAAAAVRQTQDDSPAPMRFFTINGALAKFEANKGNGNAGGNTVRHAAATPADRATDLPSIPVTPLPARGDEPFGMFSFRAPQGTLWTKWSRVQSTVAGEEKRVVDCRADGDSCDSASQTFIAMATRAEKLSGRARFEAVTHAVNGAIRYTTDLAQHGVMDQWTAPLATLASGRGDCEDYAILKYHVLRQAGTPATDLKIVLLRDTATREDHAVLAAREGERWYILDNRRAGFYVDADLPHYLPLFALNQDGVQLFAAPYALRPSLPAEQDTSPATADDSGNTPFALMALPVLL
jgi:predicted transglutaminase-like cysteine proteinase